MSERHSDAPRASFQSERRAEVSSERRGRHRLAPESLRWTCEPTDHPSFAPDAEVGAARGQSRAVEALELGLSIDAPGFNVYVAGDSGTGRTFAVRQALDALAPLDRRRVDRLFACDFDEPTRPRLIETPRGRGRALQAEMRAFVEAVPDELEKALASDALGQRRRAIADAATAEATELVKAIDLRIQDAGFGVVQIPHEPEPIRTVAYVLDGTPVPFEALKRDEALRNKLLAERIRDARDKGEDVPATPAERDRWLSNHVEALEAEASALAERLGEVLGRIEGIEGTAEREVGALEREAIEAGLAARAAPLLVEDFDAGDGAVRAHVESMLAHMLENVALFSHDEDAPPREERDDLGTWMYSLNVVQGAPPGDGAPVIIERHPTLANLFGTIERHVTPNGVATARFTHLRSGSLLDADGGFLVLYAKDVLVEPGVWRTLMRTLGAGALQIQSAESALFLLPSALKPDPVPLDVKVVLIGDEYLYALLLHYDEDFAKVFKVKAELDDTVALDEPHVADFVAAVRAIERECVARPLTASALAVLLEESVRTSGRRNRIAMCYQDVADIVGEASHLAEKAGVDAVDAALVRAAVVARRERYARVESHLGRLLNEDVLLVATDGERRGQINALAVFGNGPRRFGKPTRITASVGLGSGGVVNIEREARLSGPHHDKGMMILAGYLRRRYGRDRPLAMTASIAFEQSYGGVDGDSASLAELLVVLSEVTGVPIRQSIAVTGSINQLGDVQAIGGVNEKIEGYFDLCRARGLTGKQGCVIPRANALDLMLDADVVRACAEERFSVWTVDTIDDAIPLVFGMEADAFHVRAEVRLEEMSRTAAKWSS